MGLPNCCQGAAGPIVDFLGFLEHQKRLSQSRKAAKRGKRSNFKWRLSSIAPVWFSPSRNLPRPYPHWIKPNNQFKAFTLCVFAPLREKMVLDFHPFILRSCLETHLPNAFPDEHRILVGFHYRFCGSKWGNCFSASSKLARPGKSAIWPMASQIRATSGC